MIKKGESEPINYLGIDDFAQIVEFLQSIRAEFTEDIPDFETRYPGKLEGIIGSLEFEVFGKELYKGVVNTPYAKFSQIFKGL